MTQTVNLYAAEGCWLYKDTDDPREFLKSVTCPVSEVPHWHECTNQEKEDWEREHQPEPPEPQPQENQQ